MHLPRAGGFWATMTSALSFNMRSLCGPAICVFLVAVIALLAGCSDESTRPPTLMIDPSEIELPAGASAGAFVVRNAGSGTLTWTAQVDAHWLALAVNQGATSSADSVRFSIAPDSLWLGPLVATIGVSSSGGSATVHVRLQPTLRASPDTLDFGDSDRLKQVEIVNEGADTLRWSAVATEGWLLAVPDAGDLAPGADTLALTVARAGLPAGVYQGLLNIDGGALGRDSVRVLMTVPVGATVSGHTYYASTRIPAPAVTVSVDDISDVTDQQGAYLLPDVPVGSRTLRTHAEGFVDAEVSVQVPTDGVIVEFFLTSSQHAHTVTGRALNRRGEGIQGVAVRVLDPDDSASGLMTSTTDDGSYSLAGVPEGLRHFAWSHWLYSDSVSEVSVLGPGTDHTVQLTSRPIDPPYLPDGPDLGRVDCFRVRIGWPLRNEPTIAGYRVERGTDAHGPFIDVSGRVDPTVSFFEDRVPTLAAYQYRIRTENIDDLLGEPSSRQIVRLYPWVLLVDANDGPTERWGHTALYDAPRNRMVVNAGIGCIGEQCGVLFRDTWALDLDSYTWSLLDDGTSGPTKRQNHVAVYDEARQRMVIFGGLQVLTFFADTWAFDLAGHTWSLLHDGSGTAPSARNGHAGIYDPLGDRMVIYGGEEKSGGLEVLNDVWAFDLASQTWQRLREGGTGDVQPQPAKRRFHSAVYDASRHRMVVHGGEYISGGRQDTWAFDLATATWSQLPDGPTPRYTHAVVWDATEDRMIIYGGRSGDHLFSDVWALPLGNGHYWMRLDEGIEGPVPPARSNPSLINNIDDDELVIFGGIVGGELGRDAWAFCPQN